MCEGLWAPFELHTLSQLCCHMGMNVMGPRRLQQSDAIENIALV